jgi:hypothetical protein
MVRGLTAMRAQMLGEEALHQRGPPPRRAYQLQIQTVGFGPKSNRR